MINNTKESLLTAKSKLAVLLTLNFHSVPCTYKQSGKTIKGFIICHENKDGTSLYQNESPNVRVKSSTGKEYNKLITDIITVENLDNL